MFSFARLQFELNVFGCNDRFALYKIKNSFVDVFLEASIRLRDQNAFKDVFGQSLSTDPTALRRFQKPPLPFAFHIPVLSGNNDKKLTTTLSLSIAGSALNHVPIFLSAVKNVLNNLAVRETFNIEVTGCYSVVSDEQLSELSSFGEGLTILLPTEIHGGSNDMTLEIYTPLRIFRDGKLVRIYSFSEFIRPLMRRISSIAYYYGGVELDLDFRWLSDISKQVEFLNASFFMEKYPVIGEGVVGHVEFKGIHVDFHPFLVMGEEFNLGKGATYGGGSYKMLNTGFNR
jgi:hypothetical protein